MTMVTYRISSGTVRKHVGKPGGVEGGPCSVSPALVLAGRQRAQPSSAHPVLPTLQSARWCPHPACLALLWPQPHPPHPDHKPWGGGLNWSWSSILQGCSRHQSEVGPSDPSSSSLRGASLVTGLRMEKASEESWLSCPDSAQSPFHSPAPPHPPPPPTHTLLCRLCAHSRWISQ